MTLSRPFKNAAVALTVALVYFFAAKLGLRLAYLHASATPVWPGTGIALVAFLVLGYRVWPGILLGAFLVNVSTAGTAATSLGIALGNTLEGVVGCYLLNKFAFGRDCFDRAFDRAQEIFKFAALVGLASTAVSATFGVTSLYLGGFVPRGNFASVWCTWWLGDAVGAIVVAPLLLLWIANPRVIWNRRQLSELFILFLSLSFIGWVVFGGRFQSEFRHYPLAFLWIPILIWAAFRFGQRETATAIFLLAGIAIWGTLRGFGPFITQTPNTSLLMLQAYMGVNAITALSVAAEVSERKRAEEKVRAMAVSDPLTGLGNYRRLLEALDAEIKRTDRTGRPFALLLLDLDGLKKINDAHGHLVGSRALCRLGDILRIYCREVDVATRYGGDEFAIVLPETEFHAARFVADRIRERLSLDGELPRLSVSVGIAMCPEDGETTKELLNSADAGLYAEKNSSARRSSGKD